MGYTPAVADLPATVPLIDSPEDVIRRIERIPAESRTRAQDTALRRAYSAIDSRAGARSKADTLVDAPVSSDACPFDRTSPEGINWLLDRTLAKIESIVSNPSSTNRDVLDAGSLLRMAAGLGKADPVPEAFVLDMESMLGGLDETVEDAGSSEPT